MRTTLFAVAVSLAFAVGCQKPAEPKMEGEAPPVEENEGGIEVQAPGVDVKVGGGEGVDVEAPGVDVEAKPGEGAEVEAKSDEPQ